MLAYRPQSTDRILSCSVQSIELFSCCLSAQDDTALSIVDPFAMAIELCVSPLINQTKARKRSAGLQAITDVSLPLIEVSLHITV